MYAIGINTIMSRAFWSALYVCSAGPGPISADCPVPTAADERTRASCFNDRPKDVSTSRSSRCSGEMPSGAQRRHITTYIRLCGLGRALTGSLVQWSVSQQCRLIVWVSTVSASCQRHCQQRSLYLSLHGSRRTMQDPGAAFAINTYAPDIQAALSR